MEQERNDGRADGIPRDGTGVSRAWKFGVNGLAAFGTVMIVFLMVIIVADVAVRNLIGASLPLIAELGALTVVLIVFLQLAAAVRNDRLASTDFLLEAVARSRPRLALSLRALWDLVGALLCAGIAWATWSILLRDIEHREFIGVTGVLTMQTSPFRALILVGAIVAAVQFVLMAFARLRRVTGAGDRVR